MTRDEELRTIEEAIANGKLRRVDYGEESKVVLRFRSMQTPLNYKNTLAGANNRSKRREAQYKEQGLI